MAIVYRDYGYKQGSSAPNNAVNVTRHSQVYTATHDGAGNRLPYMNRSFISFTVGEKCIEDFNLLAIIENNSLQRRLYAEFEDNITESNVWDGQIYWSSHFNANTISFALFTDGITENQLNDFKHYFQPGHIEELTLSENPNRAIYARISESPEYSVLPFEERIKIKIAGQEYETSTTMYKGRINLEFVMDDPFWHSHANILDKLKIDGTYDSGKWIDANGHDSIILNDEDALKILTEDGVPMSMMLRDTATPMSSATPLILFGTEQPTTVDTSTSVTGSRVESATIGSGHVAFVLTTDGASINITQASTIATNDSDTDTVRTPGYFYYAGTAPCAPILQFDLTPTLSNGYIALPRNSYAYPTGTQYNTIIIQSKAKKRFTFTTPGIYTGYNQAIKIFKNSGLVNAAWEEVRVALRDNVKHWAPRAYAIKVINDVKGSTTRTTSTLLNDCVTQMQNFLKNDSNVIPAATYVFDCKTGQATATITYRTNANVVTSSAENVGDMVRSNYLIIEDRNYPTADGYIAQWTASNPQYSHRIYADAILSNVNLQYKYLYL